MRASRLCICKSVTTVGIVGKCLGSWAQHCIPSSCPGRKIHQEHSHLKNIYQKSCSKYRSHTQSWKEMCHRLKFVIRFICFFFSLSWNSLNPSVWVSQTLYMVILTDCRSQNCNILCQISREDVRTCGDKEIRSGNERWGTTLGATIVTA